MENCIIFIMSIKGCVIENISAMWECMQFYSEPILMTLQIKLNMVMTYHIYM